MITHDRLTDLITIGSGQFGEVLVGTISDCDVPFSIIKENTADEIQTPKRIQVLVKSMSSQVDESLFIEFQRQVDLHRMVDSDNVAKLVALSSDKATKSHFMVLEHHQDMKMFLEQQTSSITTKQLFSFCYQITKGLEAIFNNKLTHR